MEIGWDDILQDDFSKGIFEMELEDDDDTTDDINEDSSEVWYSIPRLDVEGDFFN